MTEILDFLKAFNAHTIISMILIVWYFSRSIGNKIDASESRMEAKMERHEQRVDRLYEMFIELIKEGRAK